MVANEITTLDRLLPGQQGTIISVNGDKKLRRHLLDMGLTPQTKVSVRRVAPMGDPIGITLRGYELTLRKDDAHNISLSMLPAE